MNPTHKSCDEILSRGPAHRFCQEIQSRDLEQRSCQTPPEDILRRYFRHRLRRTRQGLPPSDLVAARISCQETLPEHQNLAQRSCKDLPMDIWPVSGLAQHL